MKKYLFYISIIFISCQDEITLDLPQAENKLVVEATIEQGFPPYVILTKNEGYFDPVDSETFNNLFVNNIESVEIWYNNDGVKVDSVILDQITLFDSLPPIYTDINFLNNNVDFETGELTSPYNFSMPGRTYYLEIKWNNQIISAQTTIPIPTPLDCLWVEKNEAADKDFKYDIRAVYSDDGNIQNNILIRSKRIEHYERVSDHTDSLLCEIKNIPDGRLQLIDAGADVLINGQSFETYFPRPKESGFPSGAYNSTHVKDCNDSVVEFKNDVVLIKFCQIDEPSMKFWRGVVRQVGTNGNPFAEPMNLSSNINGGLGVFTGYGAVYYKVPIIKNTTIFNDTIPNIIDIF